MRSSVLGLAIALAAIGCAAEDDWIVRPPGGGTGSGTGGGSGRDGGTDGGSVSGRLCVVDDLRLPDACPTTDDAAGVRVHVRGGATITTGANGAFTLPVPTAPQVLEVGDGSTVLVPSTIPVAAGETPALRAVRATSFADVLASVAVPGLGDRGAIVVYVDDAGGASLSGATFDNPGGQWPPFYDDGAATRWRTTGGTGASGVALLVDTATGDVLVTGSGPAAQPLRLTVPVRPGALTFVRTTVP